MLFKSTSLMTHSKWRGELHTSKHLDWLRASLLWFSEFSWQHLRGKPAC